MTLNLSIDTPRHHTHKHHAYRHYATPTDTTPTGITLIGTTPIGTPTYTPIDLGHIHIARINDKV